MQNVSAYTEQAQVFITINQMWAFLFILFLTAYDPTPTISIMKTSPKLLAASGNTSTDFHDQILVHRKYYFLTKKKESLLMINTKCGLSFKQAFKLLPRKKINGI